MLDANRAVSVDERCAGSFPALAAPELRVLRQRAGAQVPDSVLEAVTDHLLMRNVQRRRPYRHSREVDAMMIARARESVAAFVNARSADEIAFGLNATSFIRAISLAVGQTLASSAGDRSSASSITKERRDPCWRLERAGARIVLVAHAARRGTSAAARRSLAAADPSAPGWWRARMPPTRPSTRRVFADVAGRAHRAGAEVFHRCRALRAARSDRRARVDCDYLVCSGVQGLFAPHMGFAWCRREAINRLPTFARVSSPDVTPRQARSRHLRLRRTVAGVDAARSRIWKVSRPRISRDSFCSASGRGVGAFRHDPRRDDTIAGVRRTLSNALRDVAAAFQRHQRARP
jgi:hypothetical protein